MTSSKCYICVCVCFLCITGGWGLSGMGMKEQEKKFQKNYVPICVNLFPKSCLKIKSVCSFFSILKKYTIII